MMYMRTFVSNKISSLSFIPLVTMGKDMSERWNFQRLERKVITVLPSTWFPCPIGKIELINIQKGGKKGA